MSAHAAAPAPAPAPAAAAEPSGGPALPADPVKDLALQIYIELAGRSFSGPAQDGRPEPKALAVLSFTLAEAFLHTHRDINKALTDAAAKRDSFSFNDVDMGAMMKG